MSNLDIVQVNPEDDDVLELADWLESVEDSCFMDCDGFGEAIKWDGISDTAEMLSEEVYPSEKDKVPEGTTHIIWYNK